MEPLFNMTPHHIGYLVKNIDKATAEFTKLGYSIIKEKQYDDYRKVDITFLELDGYVVELVAPASEGSIVDGLMSRYKNAPYHICYEVEDFDNTSIKLSQNGYVAIDEATPAPAIDGKKVQFFMNRFTGMIEIVEK